MCVKGCVGLYLRRLADRAFARFHSGSWKWESGIGLFFDRERRGGGSPSRETWRYRRSLHGVHERTTVYKEHALVARRKSRYWSGRDGPLALSRIFDELVNRASHPVPGLKDELSWNRSIDVPLREGALPVPPVPASIHRSDSIDDLIFRRNKLLHLLFSNDAEPRLRVDTSSVWRALRYNLVA